MNDRWPAWRWARNGAGPGGRVPADILTHPGPSRATEEFDTRELTGSAGVRLALLRQSRG